MYYLVFDLEFNQDFSSLSEIHALDDSGHSRPRCPFEIIQIGAVKLDENFKTISTFNRFVKPVIYSEISPFVTELTGITKDSLINQDTFSRVYQEFIDFIGDSDSILCTWGMSDLKELFRNVTYHGLNYKYMPESYINIQPYASRYLGLPSNKLLRLQHVVEALTIPASYDFHNAQNDAWYTAEILKKIYNPSIKPKLYNPNYIPPKPRQPKRVVDFDALIQQFEKMYQRTMTEDEQEMIQLAYKMGRTQQFIKNI